MKKYIKKNGKKIVKEVSRHKETKKRNFSILTVIENHIFEDDIAGVLEQLSDFLNFQKAFL